VFGLVSVFGFGVGFVFVFRFVFVLGFVFGVHHEPCTHRTVRTVVCDDDVGGTMSSMWYIKQIVINIQTNKPTR